MGDGWRAMESKENEGGKGLWSVGGENERRIGHVQTVVLQRRYIPDPQAGGQGGSRGHENIRGGAVGKKQTEQDS
jgi:hypothetical protein